MRLGALLFGLAAFSSTAIRGGAGGQAGSPPADLRLTASLDRDRYEVGEPIIVTITVTNWSPRPHWVISLPDDAGRSAGYRFEVRRNGGPPLPSPGPCCVGSGPGGVRTLPPFDSYSRPITLNEHVPVLEPGRYSVKVVSPAESATLPFEVSVTPPETLRARVAALLEKLQGATSTRDVIRLLAYTGHPEAMPALVDGLYGPNDGFDARVGGLLALFDPTEVIRALRQALQDRGPSSKMVFLLVVTLQSRPEDVVPLLLPWLSSPHDGTRRAAVEGLSYVVQSTKDPKLFAPLAAMLHDPTIEVRGAATAAIAAYANEAAFEALHPLLANPARPDTEQAVIGMGWIATAATPGSLLRQRAIKLLEAVANGGSAIAHQARYWLGRVAAP